MPTTHLGRLSICERVAVGLVGVITPWNFPLVLGMRVIAPALTLGNAVLIKPSPETPLSGGLALAELFAGAGLPAGLFQVLPGDVEVGDRLVTHPDIVMIHFTGSTAVGRQIARTAGGLLKKVSLELGRQQRADRARRRRPGAGDNDRRLVEFPLPGPDVHYCRTAHRH